MRQILFLLMLLVWTSYAMQSFELEKTRGGYQFELTLPEYTIETVSVNEALENGTPVNQNFTKVTVPSYTTNGEVGAPRLLSGTFELALEDSAVSISYTVIEADTLQLTAPLYPKQHALASCSNGKREYFSFDKAAYENSRTGDVTSVTGIYTFRNQLAATISVAPMQYDGTTNTLILIKKIAISIDAKEPTAVRSAGSETFDGVIRNRFKNLQGELGKSVPSAKVRADESYLIICAPEYLNNSDLKTLIDYRSFEFDVEVVENGTFGSSKDDYRSYIRGKMPTYVLCVGDDSDFPHHTFSFNLGQSITVKSFSYWVGAQTSGEPSPDIAMGFFMVNNATELKNMVDKTIAAEAANEDMPNTFVGHGGNKQQMGSLAPDHCDKVVKEMWERFFQPEGYDYVSAYSVLTPTGGKEKDIQATNDGARFINYNGHGMVNEWVYGWGNSDINSLTNDEFFPYVLSCCCYTGTFDQNCMSRAYTTDNNGPSAFIASYEQSSMGQHPLNYGLYEAIITKDITRYGTAFVYAANSKTSPQSTKSMPADQSTTRLMQWQYHLYGDPALETMKTPVFEDHVTIKSPNGGEELEQNSTATIRWSSNVKDTKVKLTLLDGGDVVEVLADNEENDGKFDWAIDEEFNLSTTYKIVIETDTLSDTSDANFSVVPEYIIDSFPYAEPFEDYTSGMTTVGKWTQDIENDEIDWIVLNGITPTGQFGVDQGQDPGTGPMGDHTSGSGNYIYMEATENYQDNKSCRITSPKINLNRLKDPELTYWLQMNSLNNKMGKVQLDIIVDGEVYDKVEQYNGHKGLEWFSDTVDLTPYKGKRVQVQFYATVGDSFYSDICLDDIKIDGEIIETPILFDEHIGADESSLICSPSILSPQFSVVDILMKEQDILSYEIAIFDMTGNLLFEQPVGTVPAAESGYHKLGTWKGTNLDGMSVASGSYLVLVKTTDKTYRTKVYKKVVGVQE